MDQSRFTKNNVPGAFGLPVSPLPSQEDSGSVALESSKGLFCLGARLPETLRERLAREVRLGEQERFLRDFPRASAKPEV